MKNLTRRGFLGAGAAVAAVAAMGLAGCGGSKTEQKPADSEVSLDTLIVGFDAAYPPYGFVADDGSYTGFDLDLAQAVCEMEGWEFKAEPIDWDAKDALLGAGTINCIWNGFTIEGREDKYSFTEPYMINAQVVVTKKGAGIAALADLKDKIVLTQKGSAALEVLQGDKKDVADTFKELQTIADYNNAFMQLESGAVDAVACDLSIAAFQMAAKPDAFTQIEETLSEEHYGVGFLLGDEGAALADKVTEDLRKLNDEGKVKELCEKYAEQGMAYENWVLD
ncbi:MAG: transporter substrate-binding domain-containing protein [Coriobacteriaceae bacterium]|nr:transporter substrate-binding domain-containing protein [Coriobacteriaceae bacterium]